MNAHLSRWHAADVAWLAGLLEGEGCFRSLNDTREGRFPQVRITLKMVDKDVVERAQALMEAKSILPVPPVSERHQTQYTISVSGPKACEVMRRIRPYMGERRRAKIDELLSVPRNSKRKTRVWNT